MGPNGLRNVGEEEKIEKNERNCSIFMDKPRQTFTGFK